MEANSLPNEPFLLFGQWFTEAKASGLNNPNAMCLSTIDAQGAPNARFVLLKDWSNEGLVFFTNYLSPKSVELANLPKCAATFFWDSLEKQVRIRGSISKVSEAESARYFATRPRDSQIAAWASEQSQTIESRDILTQKVSRLNLQFGEGPIALPPFWGGWRLSPNTIEFWEGRPNRLHDRFVYTKDEHNKLWTIKRLSP